MSEPPSPAPLPPEQLGRLIGHLSEAEHHGLLAGEVDAAFDPVTEAPLLLRSAEEVLRRREYEFRALVENSPDLIARYARDLRYLYVNPAAEQVTGLPPSAFIGLTDRQLNSPTGHCSVWCTAVEEVFESGVGRELEITYPGPAGDRCYHARFVPESARDGGVATVMSIWRDITDRRFAEHDRAQKVALLESTGEGIFGLDARGVCTFINRAALNVLGYSAEELIGRSLSQILQTKGQNAVASDASDAEGPVARTLRTGEPVRLDAVTLWRRDGTSFPADFAAYPVATEEASLGAVVTFRDITERKSAEQVLRETEARYRQAQKMEAVGRLAGGIAHDFNNLLQVIVGNTQMVLSTTAGAGTMAEDLEEILRAANRASSLTHQLLAFSRKQVLDPKITSLNEVVVQLERMLHRLIGEDIQLITTLDPTLWQVEVDPGQIGQVLMNLVINARDAMPQGGKLLIETANEELDEEFSELYGFIRPGPYVRLTVTDTGHGMTAEVQKQIFEPFFTTKPVGEGTGLGLSTVYGVVKQTGGYVLAFSEEGEGSSFMVYLPRVGGAGTEPVASPAEGSPRDLRGTETILLVEDEAAVRLVTRKLLQRRGYTVLEATSGDEAISLCERYLGRIDLLLTDVVMPGLSGREVALEAGRIRPDTRVLYMSGYTADVIARHDLLGTGSAFLQKPFTPDTLMKRVRDVLDT